MSSHRPLLPDSMAPIAFSCRQPPYLLEITSLLPVSDVSSEKIGYMFRKLNDSFYSGHDVVHFHQY